MKVEIVRMGDEPEPLGTSFRLGLSLRRFNGSVRRLRRAKGLTQKQLADYAGVGITVVSQVETLRERPAKKHIDALADFLEVSPQDIWPDWLDPVTQAGPLETIVEIDEQRYAEIESKWSSPLEMLPQPEPGRSDEERAVIAAALEGVLKTLTWREREIIKLRYGVGDGYTYTLDEVGRIFKVNRERVRQIEAKAIRKLQQPTRTEKLKGFLDDQ